MKKEFLPYELEVELVELGFNEKTFDVHSDIVTSGFKVVKKPTPRILFQQAFRFFREKYKLHSCIVLPINKIDYAYEIKNISENIREDFLSEMQSGIIYKSYEDAELACIRKLIEIAKEQNVK